MPAWIRATGLAMTLALLGIRGAEARPAEPAQSSPTWEGARGVTRSVADIMATPMETETFWKPPRVRRPLASADRRNPPGFIDGLTPFQQSASTATLGTSPPLFSPQTVGTSFLGAQISESGFLPPDSMGAVGPSQFLVAVNGRVKVFDKLGTLGPLNTTLDTFFSSVMPVGAGTTDPRCRFDRLSQRWFVTCLSADVPNRILLAVSSGATITASTDFTFFFFQQDLVGTTPNSDTGDFADYDTLGIDANALYIGVSVFTPPTANTFVGTTGFVVRKSSLLAGGPIVVTAFRQLVAGTGAGPSSPQGVDNDDPLATEGYFIGADNAAFSLLQLRRVSNPGGTPTISGNISLTVPTTTFPQPAQALGSTLPLDSGDDRLMMATIKNGSLWTVHNINVDQTGAGVTTTGVTGRCGCRWYQIDGFTSTPTLTQSGTAFDPTVVTSGTARNFWMPSVAVSGQGHMALGCSVAAPTNSAGSQLQASVGVTGRLGSDPLGTTQALTIATPGAGNYNPTENPPATTVRRWGDFSFTSVDPADNMTMWTVQEYCNATNSWAVRVLRLAAPPPATPFTASPNTVGLSTPSVAVVITGTSTAGSGFFDPGAAFPNRLAASVTGGITVNGVTFTDPTHMTLDLNVPAGATLGAQDVTITNPDGQTLTLTGGVTVVGVVAAPPPPPSGHKHHGCGLLGLEAAAVFGLAVLLRRRGRRPPSDRARGSPAWR